ncbi:MAG TPA: recombinase family protein [Bryobacteraceae bacterium]|jgi:hypothetical protein|nr:recombinase family protein [Bryobacteraceae bacterium]
MKETIRDVVTGELTLDYFMKRSAEGWKLASVEWTRESEKAQPATALPQVLTNWADLPYGLQVARDGVHLEENPLETAVLLLILEQIVKEKRIHEIAWQLNMQGYSTRHGRAWSASDVFEMLPRLIEAGPTLLKSAVWQQRRPAPQTTH